MSLTLLILAGSLSALLFLVMLALKFYVVVKPNQAHVVVTMGKGRKTYHPAKEGSKSAYLYFGFLMQRIIVSLENVKHEINQVELRDRNFAPFKCDITCWFKIENPELAAEKLDVDSEGNIMVSIKETLDAQVQGVVRAAAMKQEIVELMEDRKTFGSSVFEEVNGDLDEWGVKLVKLEIIDFSDTDESHVINDYEQRREAEISSATRQLVALKEQEASVKEAEAKKISEKARLDSEQEIEMRDVLKLESVGTRKEEAKIKIAAQAERANAKQVEADKTKVVGEATYTAEAQVIVADGQSKSQAKLAEGQKAAKITIATGEAEAVKLDANAQAEATNKKGTATAEVIRKTGEAEAVATEKKADAQKKFTDASKDIELAKIAADIQKTQYTSMANALQKANIQIVGEDMKFMGFGAKEGAGIGNLVSALQKSSGIDFGKILETAVGKKSKEKQTTTDDNA
jgi:flotillin